MYGRDYTSSFSLHPSLPSQHVSLVRFQPTTNVRTTLPQKLESDVEVRNHTHPPSIHSSTPRTDMLNFEDVEDRDGEFYPRSRLFSFVTVCRRSFVVERMAVLQDRSHSHRRPHLCPLHPPQAARRSPASPLRARHMQASLPRRAQSLLVSPVPSHTIPRRLYLPRHTLQPNRHPRQTLDMSLLLATQRFPSTLQRHLKHQSPR